MANGGGEGHFLTHTDVTEFVSDEREYLIDCMIKEILAISLVITLFVLITCGILLLMQYYSTKYFHVIRNTQDKKTSKHIPDAIDR